MGGTAASLGENRVGLMGGLLIAAESGCIAGGGGIWPSVGYDAFWGELDEDAGYVEWPAADDRRDLEVRSNDALVAGGGVG